MSQTPNQPTVDATAPTPPPTAGPQRPPLRRSRDDRVLGGVCTGVARYLGIDPVLVRVIVVALAIFGGGGILLYLAAWFLIPEEGRDESAAQQLIGGHSSSTVLLVVVGIVVVASLMLSTSGMWFGMGPHFGPPGALLLIGAIALTVWLVRRNDTPSVTAAPTQPTPSHEVTSMTSSVDQPTQVLAVTTAPPNGPTYYGTATYEPDPTPPVKPNKPRSVLGLLTVSVTALVAGILITINMANSTSAITTTTVLAASLAVVAVGLLIGTFVGRSRGLIVLGIILSLTTAASAALEAVDISGGVGERNWAPTTSQAAAEDFRLGVGEATLDLRDLAIPSTGLVDPVSASVGIGKLIVLVPDDVDVDLSAEVGLGQVNINGELASRNDADVHTTIDVPNEAGTIALDLEMGLGDIAVRTHSTTAVNHLEQGALR